MPERLLVAAQVVAGRPAGATSGLWPRASAHLARQALEEALDELWQTRAPGAAEASTHTQLLCLRSYVPDELAGDVSYAWWALTRACHYHPYELPPTAGELETAFGVVGRLVQVSAPTPGS